MVLNECGLIAQEEWIRTARIRENVILDKFIVMPNHIHGIIINDVGAYGNTPLRVVRFRSPSMTIGAIVRGYKSVVTKRVNELCGVPSNPVWQRNYYERIVRDELESHHIKEYISNNPLKWDEDQNNPANFKN